MALSPMPGSERRPSPKSDESKDRPTDAEVAAERLAARVRQAALVNPRVRQSEPRSSDNGWTGD